MGPRASKHREKMRDAAGQYRGHFQAMQNSMVRAWVRHRERWVLLGVGLVIVTAVLAGTWVLKRNAVSSILATYPDRFAVTLYYTPRQSGFTAENGFDTTPETRPGLQGREFPRDFLLAVEEEGFGRLTEPHRGLSYIFYHGGKWGFAERPVDVAQQPLLPKKSCAISPAQKIFPGKSSLSVQLKGLPEEFGAIRWLPSDIGSGVEEWQLDLYWGEDDPRGPGRERALPRTAPLLEGAATVTVWR
jgi:hypothetical protein